MVPSRTPRKPANDADPVEQLRAEVAELRRELPAMIASAVATALRIGRAPPPESREELAGRERAMVVEALDAEGWNQKHAAKRLGIPLRTFYRRMLKFGLKQPGERAVKPPSRSGAKKRKRA